jgi:hypothetical protein
MVKKSVQRLVVVLPVLIGVLVLFGSTSSSPVQASSTQISLQAPSFAGDTAPNAISSVLDREAGIAAYYQAPQPVNLSQIRGLFHTIEIETGDYLLGTITPPSNWEDYDVHVYIHKSGWMLAYYLRDAETARLFDWQTYTDTMTPTRFQAVLNHVATTLAMPTPTLTYYDFRYPNATNLLLAIEDTTATSGEESFTLLDTEFRYFERSWGLGGTYVCWNACSYGAYAEYKVDGTVILKNEAYRHQRFDYGFLSPTQFPPDGPHTIAVYARDDTPALKMGVLAIVYGPQS